MSNASSRWLQTILLSIVLCIFALGGTGTRQVAPMTAQDVHVTNTATQQVPVLPPSRPSATGSYVVSVANVPSARVFTSPGTPLQVKSTDGGASTAFQVFVQPVLLDQTYYTVVKAYVVPAGKRFIIENVSIWSGSNFSGNYSTLTDILLYKGDFLGQLAIPVNPTFGSQVYAAGNLACEMIADAGTDVDVKVNREVANQQGDCTSTVLLSGHLVNYP